MATKLTKQISRELLSTEQQGKHRGKPYIVTLLPGDEISFRAKGSRKTYSIFLGHCMRLAQIMTIESEYKQKLADYTMKKKAGMRAVKPRRPLLPFSKMYFDAIKR